MPGMVVRKPVEPKIKEIEAQFRQAQASGEYPSDEEIVRQLDAIARGEAVVASSGTSA